MRNPGKKKAGAKEGLILRVTLYLDSKIGLKRGCDKQADWTTMGISRSG